MTATLPVLTRCAGCGRIVRPRPTWGEDWQESERAYAGDGFEEHDCSAGYSASLAPTAAETAWALDRMDLEPPPPDLELPAPVDPPLEHDWIPWQPRRLVRKVAAEMARGSRQDRSCATQSQRTGDRTLAALCRRLAAANVDAHMSAQTPVRTKPVVTGTGIPSGGAPTTGTPEGAGGWARPAAASTKRPQRKRDCGPPSQDARRSRQEPRSAPWDWRASGWARRTAGAVTAPRTAWWVLAASVVALAVLTVLGHGQLPQEATAETAAPAPRPALAVAVLDRRVELVDEIRAEVVRLAVTNSGTRTVRVDAEHVAGMDPRGWKVGAEWLAVRDPRLRALADGVTLPPGASVTGWAQVDLGDGQQLTGVQVQPGLVVDNDAHMPGWGLLPAATASL